MVVTNSLPIVPQKFCLLGKMFELNRTQFDFAHGVIVVFGKNLAQRREQRCTLDFVCRHRHERCALVCLPRLSPCWEPCASHPPGTRRACWEKPCAPEGQRTSLSAASCHARSAQQRATTTRNVTSQKDEKLILFVRTLVVLTLIWSLKAKCLPEETSASISWILIWSRLRFSLLASPSKLNSSLYWSEIWSTTLPTCLWKSRTAYRRNTHTHLGKPVPKMSFLCVVCWVFTFSALQGPGGNGDLGGINCATLKGKGDTLLEGQLHTQLVV